MKPVLAHKRKEKAIAIHPKEPSSFMQQINDFINNIEKRAYELFELRGRENGHDLDDWFKAETELFTAVPLEIKEEKKRLLIRAEVPGFDIDDLQISLEPALLTIKGSHKEEIDKNEKEASYNETRERKIFRQVTLPVNVLPDSSEANLKGGVLEISARKAEVRNIEVAA
jgi:HSP20 family protein